MENGVKSSGVVDYSAIMNVDGLEDDEVEMSDEEILNSAIDRSHMARKAEITLMGDRNTLVQIVTLLSYIRTAIRTNTKCEMKVNVCRNILNGDFEFLLNDTRTEDLVPKETIDIN